MCIKFSLLILLPCCSEMGQKGPISQIGTNISFNLNYFFKGLLSKYSRIGG